MKKKKKKSGRILILIGVLLIAAALGKAAYNIWDGVRAGRESQEIAQQLLHEIPKDSDTEDAKPADTGEQDANADEEKNSEKITTVELDGTQYLGLLNIPSLDLQLPVMAEWNYENLRTAPCRYTGSVSDNNLVIAGHNYSGHFQDLKTLEHGDAVVLTTAAGEKISYTVDHIETLGAQEISTMITADNWELTLFTCTVGGKSRYAVRCIREKNT